MTTELSSTIDLAAAARPLTRFWRITGYSPAQQTTTQEMRLNLNYIDAVCGRGIEFIRPHWLLDLVAVEGIESDDPRYDWSAFYACLDTILENDLKLVFELMGLPSNRIGASSVGNDSGYQGREGAKETYFTDLENEVQVRVFHRFVQDVVRNLIERYGRETVRSWWFESTNEPDLQFFWPWSVQAYLNYYDACSEALRAVDPALRFGGPACANGYPPISRALLRHCVEGTNFITGERGSRIDFFTQHRKNNPDTTAAQELADMEEIRREFPALANIPFLNTEADPTWQWNKDRWWHAQAWHAAFIARAVAVHLEPAFADGSMAYLGMCADNAFRGGWGFRTQLARFMNDDGSRVSFVKKPVLAVHSLLELLGGEYVPVSIPGEHSEHVGITATRGAEGYAILAHNLPKMGDLYAHTGLDVPASHQEAIDRSHARLRMRLAGIEPGRYTVVEHRIDDEFCNPAAVWRKHAWPLRPTDEQLRDMRVAHELRVAGEPVEIDIAEGDHEIAIELPAASVSLVRLLIDPGSVPAAVQRVKRAEYTGINGSVDTMLRWDHPCPAIVRTYEIEASGADGRPTPVHLAEMLDQGFLHSQPAGSAACAYRIRPIDLWSRAGEWTEVS